MPEDAPGLATSQRIDQWLWYARIVKSRTLAQSLIERSKVRINRVHVEKPSQNVKPGDVVTITLGPAVRVFEIAGIGTRRGPASEAVGLYRELTTIKAPAGDPGQGSKVSLQPSVDSGGRPTKKDRRALQRLKGKSW